MKHIADTKRENLDRKTIDENAKSSIFRYIVSSDMPESERSMERLSREAMVLLGAGTATTARTMGFACYYSFSNPRIRERLGEELREVMKDFPERVPRWADLEKLEYLGAVIKEALRCVFITPLSSLPTFNTICAVCFYR